MNEYTSINGVPEDHANHWRWFIFIGIILIIIGILALAYEFIATVFSIYYIAVLLIFAGAAQLVQSFKTRRLGNTILWGIIGLLYLIAGIIALYNPIAISVALTLLIAFLLILSGIIQIIGAYHNRILPRWGWLLFSGIVTLLLGLLILTSWPSDSLWVLGLFLGIDFLFQGWAYISIGFAMRSWHIE